MGFNPDPDSDPDFDMDYAEACHTHNLRYDVYGKYFEEEAL